MSKLELLTILREYENDKSWWSFSLFEENANLQDFMAWLEDSTPEAIAE